MEIKVQGAEWVTRGTKLNKEDDVKFLKLCNILNRTQSDVFRIAINELYEKYFNE